MHKTAYSLPKNTNYGNIMQNQIDILEKLCQLYELDKTQGYKDTYIKDVKFLKFHQMRR